MLVLMLEKACAPYKALHVPGLALNSVVYGNINPGGIWLRGVWTLIFVKSAVI